MMFHGGIKMKKYIVVGFIAIVMTCFINHEVSAQGVWKNYTNANCINDIAIEGDYIWCATTGGVVRWDRRDGSYVKYTSADGLSHNAVNCITIGPDDVKWFGTGYGVSCLDADNWTTYVLSDGIGREYERNMILGLAVDRDGVVWAGTRGLNGISSLAGNTWNCDYSFVDAYGYTTGLVREVIVDRTNTKWFVTDDEMIVFDGESWAPVLASKIFLADSDNVKWFISQNNITTFDGEHWETKYSEGPWPAEDIVTAMAEGPDKLKWFATNGSGIYSWDGENWLNYTEADGLPSNDVTAIVVDEDNVVWAGTEYGLASFDGTECDIRLTNDLLGDNGVSAIAVDSNDTKWFVSSHIGIFTYDNVEWNVLARIIHKPKFLPV